jgi:hypothetical protein
MSPNQQSRTNVPTQNRRCADEYLAWTSLYGAIGEAATAAEIVKQLDADPQSKHDHLALYIRAQTTLRKQKVADDRNRRLGAFVRLVLTSVVQKPARTVKSVLSTTAAIGVEALPPVRREPAKARVEALRGDPDFAHDKDRFPPSVEGTAEVLSNGESGNAKAA